jgi:hypothetical protein
MRQSVCRSACTEVSHEAIVRPVTTAWCDRRRRRSGILRAVSAVSLLASGGCDHDAISNPAICQENVAYIGIRLPCHSLSDCPSGTTCDQRKAADAGDPSAGGDAHPQKFCVPAVFPRIDDSILFNGLRVAEIELHRNATAAAAVYEAVVPSDVVGLSCSLYVAMPDLKSKPGSRGRVNNAASAIYRTHLFRIDTSSGSGLRTIQFGIGDLTPRAGSSDVSTQTCYSGLLDAFSSALNAQYPPIVSALRVGCIGLGQQEIVGATRLQSVVLAELPESQMILTDCSGEDQSGIGGRLCMAPESLGRCVRCACQPPGATSLDGSAVDGPSATPASSIDAGALSTGSAASQELPVKKCSGLDEGRACAIGAQRLGRCVESRCALLDGQKWDPPLVISNCAGSFGVTDGLNCYDSRIDGYGTCYASECRTRCVNSGDDCSERNGLLTGTPHLCAHARRASGRSPSYLGLCLPADWFDGTQGAAEPAAVDAGVCVAGPGAGETASSGVAPGELGDRFCVVESEVFKCH